MTMPDPRTPYVPGQPTPNEYWPPQPTASTQGLAEQDMRAPAPRKNRLWLLFVAVGALFIVIAVTVGIALGSGSNDTTTGIITSDTTRDPTPEATTEAPTEATTAAPTATKATRAVSVEEQNAIQAAKDYLDYGAFSRKGLIRQLSSDAGEGYPVKLATRVVDSLHVDWKEQAYLSAKSYLEYDSFSRNGLIRQLESDAGEGFSHAQAVYGVTKAGL
jgi:hypothetical protein